jgi:hypothetical protein
MRVRQNSVTLDDEASANAHGDIAGIPRDPVIRVLGGRGDPDEALVNVGLSSFGDRACGDSQDEKYNTTNHL